MTRIAGQGRQASIPTESAETTNTQTNASALAELKFWRRCLQILGALSTAGGLVVIIAYIKGAHITIAGVGYQQDTTVLVRNPAWLWAAGAGTTVGIVFMVASSLLHYFLATLDS